MLWYLRVEIAADIQVGGLEAKEAKEAKEIRTTATGSRRGSVHVAALVPVR